MTKLIHMISSHYSSSQNDAALLRNITFHIHTKCKSSSFKTFLMVNKQSGKKKKFII